MISLGTDGDILQHIRTHVPPSNAVHGENTYIFIGWLGEER
jgi:hypothetical protein